MIIKIIITNKTIIIIKMQKTQRAGLQQSLIIITQITRITQMK